MMIDAYIVLVLVMGCILFISFCYFLATYKRNPCCLYFSNQLDSSLDALSKAKKDMQELHDYLRIKRLEGVLVGKEIDNKIRVVSSTYIFLKKLR